MQNRISTVSGATSPLHSANGEMTRDETGQLLAYDAWGRLVTVNTDGTGGVEITNLYDALHRWIKRNSNEFYNTAQWQQIEERDAQGVEAQFVWSSVYIDAMVLRDRDSDNDGVMEATDERLYVVHDANFNITALIAEDGTWQVIERFIYDAYGTRSVLDANWSADADGTSDYGFSFGHQGGRHDVLARTVYFRERWLITSLGRWNRQDPLGYIDGLALSVFAISNPVAFRDPAGQMTIQPRDPSNGLSLVPVEEGPSSLLGKCGNFASTNKWQLDNPSASGGWVIQCLTVTIRNTKCENCDPGPKSPNCTAAQTGVSYCEAWKVGKGKSTPQPAADTFRFKGCGKCSKGSITFEASASYYDGAELPPEYRPGHPGLGPWRDWPGKLPARPGLDPGVQGGTPPTPHSITVSWDCCECMSDSKVESAEPPFGGKSPTTERSRPE